MINNFCDDRAKPPSNPRPPAGQFSVAVDIRARKFGHHAALRRLANRLVGILHGCFKTGTRYDHTAWHHEAAVAA